MAQKFYGLVKPDILEVQSLKAKNSDIQYKNRNSTGLGPGFHLLKTLIFKGFFNPVCGGY